MPLKQKLLCSAYLGPTCYFSELLDEAQVEIEVFENFQKQTIRNRCKILGPNGLQILSIPIQKNSGKQQMRDLRISYAEDWQKVHWKSIQTAYGSAPFFEVLAPELEPFYLRKTEFLVDLNLQLTELVLQWIQEKTELYKSSNFTPLLEDPLDLRFAFNAKNLSGFQANAYSQINAYKQPFEPNLSIIDLLFNEGPMAWELLHLKPH